MNSDYYLVLGAASEHVQIVLFKTEVDCTSVSILCAQDWLAPSRGTEIMPSALNQMLELLDLHPSTITRIACVSGPGSFTGIRLCLAFGAALRRGTGALIAGISFLSALSYEAILKIRLDRKFVIRVITHARHDLVHGQDFFVDPLTPSEIPVAISMPEMWSITRAGDGIGKYLGDGYPVRIIGSGVARHMDDLLSVIPSGADVKLIEDITYPSPHSLIKMSLEANYSDVDPEPIYLRQCDAYDNLSSIALSRGDSFAEAERQLEQALAHSADAI